MECAASEYVEGVVCKESDVKENEMKTFDLEDGKVLIVRQNGELHALGSKCTHYGAPLDKAALGEGRIRCQWHGACFNLKTGDIEDFPGLDSLPCHKVSVENGNVIVRALKSQLESNKRSKIPRKKLCLEPIKFVIVGGGPSGATCAEKLRQEGFNGHITLINKEDCLPYDRVKVSKALNVDVKTIQLRTPEFYKDIMVDTKVDSEVVEVDTKGKKVKLCNGESLEYDKLYLATGARARKLNMPGSDLKNVVTLRTFKDGNYINSQLTEDTNVVILGASFIGMEAAAYLVDKCKSVTVVGKESVPFEMPFGVIIGQRVMELFEEKGCKFIMKNSVKECKGDNDKLTEVVLEDGTTLPADIFIMGVGVIYNTEFLKGSEIEMNPNGSVPVNEYMETNIKDVYAGGDIAQAPVYVSDNEKFNIGHYGLSHFHGKVAALNMLGQEHTLQSVPYFWTMFFGKGIRYAGHGMYNDVKIFGDMTEMKFIAYYTQGEKVVSMASCGRDPVVSKFAELLAQGKRVYLKDIEEGNLPWSNEA